MTTPLTFRDFAGAIMSGDHHKAASVLESLLALAPEHAAPAAAHFAGQMKDPSFLPKAMSLRTAVQSGSDAELAALLAACFALSEPALSSSVAALRARYAAPE